MTTIEELNQYIDQLRNWINPEIRFIFRSDEARKFGVPFYRYDGDAGVDLHVILPEEDREEGLTIYPGEREMLDSGLQIALPPHVFARITHRSSTEKRKRLRVIEGTIDSGFRGPIYSQVSNDNTFPIKVHHGDRIAQLVLTPVLRGEFTEVEELPASERGNRGFGSTGKSQ